MAESSKSGASNPTQALKGHFDQDRSAHASHQSNWRNPAGSFRNPQYPGQQKLADQQYALEQLGNLSLDDAVRANSPGLSIGRDGTQRFPTPIHFRGQTSMFIDENTPVISGPASAYTGTKLGSNGPFHPEYLTNAIAPESTAVNAAMGSSSGTAMDMNSVTSQMPIHHNMHPAYVARAFPPPFGAQSGLMHRDMGYSPFSMANLNPGVLQANEAIGKAVESFSAADDALLISLRQSGMEWDEIANKFPMQTSFTCSLRHHDLMESQKGMAASREDVAAAWEASFEEAMDEWMSTQTNLEATEALDAAEASTTEETQDKPLNSSELARAAQQLVDAVSDNDSEKFRKSNFVDLMRRIAAQEIIVENNSLVEVNSAVSDPNTEIGVMSDVAGSTTSKDKGKGKAVALPGFVDDAE